MAFCCPESFKKYSPLYKAQQQWSTSDLHFPCYLSPKAHLAKAVAKLSQAQPPILLLVTQLPHCFVGTVGPCGHLRYLYYVQLLSIFVQELNIWTEASGYCSLFSLSFLDIFLHRWRLPFCLKKRSEKKNLPQAPERRHFLPLAFAWMGGQLFAKLITASIR